MWHRVPSRAKGTRRSPSSPPHHVSIRCNAELPFRWKSCEPCGRLLPVRLWACFRGRLTEGPAFIFKQSVQTRHLTLILLIPRRTFTATHSPGPAFENQCLVINESTWHLCCIFSRIKLLGFCLQFHF